MHNNNDHKVYNYTLYYTVIDLIDSPLYNNNDHKVYIHTLYYIVVDLIDSPCYCMWFTLLFLLQISLYIAEYGADLIDFVNYHPTTIASITPLLSTYFFTLETFSTEFKRKFNKK